MSEEYNPEARVLEEVERIEVELKDVIHRRDQTDDAKKKQVLQQQIDDLEHKLKHLRGKLG